MHAWAKLPVTAADVDQSAQLQRSALHHHAFAPHTHPLSFFHLLIPTCWSKTHFNFRFSFIAPSFLFSVWEQHQRELQLQQDQRKLVTAQLVQASSALHQHRFATLCNPRIAVQRRAAQVRHQPPAAGAAAGCTVPCPGGAFVTPSTSPPPSSTNQLCCCGVCGQEAQAAAPSSPRCDVAVAARLQRRAAGALVHVAVTPLRLSPFLTGQAAGRYHARYRVRRCCCCCCCC